MFLKGARLRHILCFTFMSCCLSYKQNWLNDFDFSKIPEVCAPESCSDTEDQYGSQKCDCDEKCSRYGTCCFDSPHVSLSPMRTFGKREECSKVWESNFGVFMVSCCNPRWRGHQVIRTLCEGVTPSDRDPLAGIPVTSPFSKITYKNFFCSLCNFDHREGILWKFVLTFPHNKVFGATPDKKEDILRHLEYDQSQNKWGIWNTSSDGSFMEFVPLTVSAEVPRSAKSLVKLCDFNLESRCSRTWNDETVKRKCQSYIAPVTLLMGEGSARRYVKFRNPHCAVCNYVTDFEEAFCFETPHAPPSLSFTLLLDVNPSDGDEVGVSETCAENEVHDPFFKKCRALVCALPGYTVKNGRCVNT